jgi:hypothetical protein
MTPENPENPQSIERRMEGLHKQAELLKALTESHLEVIRKTPILEAAREAALLPRYAIIATRVHALEEGFHELSKLAVDTYTVVGELHELLTKIQRRLEEFG